MKLLASLIFFTRLPFWKIADVPPVYFKRVVDYWPFVGWLTGGIMAGTLWITAEFLPVQIAVLMALAARLLVTGALHEDGLADFCDGFGGGTSRDKILSIMKDSHIGTYGVLGLLFYYGLMWNILTTLSVPLACAAILSGDAWSKFCAAQIINTPVLIFKGLSIGRFYMQIICIPSFQISVGNFIEPMHFPISEI
jgi:adenosylcobinamide-GDP ribazoletransferase